jgi:hypothetical protein
VGCVGCVGGVGGVGVWGVWRCGGCGGCGGVFPLRSNIPRSALCATLDTYNFYIVQSRNNFAVCEMFTAFRSQFRVWLQKNLGSKV